jgi:tetraacyldisaccharide 4'-kinase
VGNLTSGGTGKTPHTEYLVKLLKDHFRLAVLSRGYGRKSSGYVLSVKETSAIEIGDEPYQISRKFPEIKVAVSEDRLAGISRLKNETNTQLVILDDAFQHRRLKGDLNILLTDYNRPYWNDLLLPAGNLRDGIMEKRRADIFIITKCPLELDQMEMKKITTTVSPAKHQKIFFTGLQYGTPVQFNGPAMSFNAVYGFAGLASTQLFEKHLYSNFDLKRFRAFRDHHIFSHEELTNLWNDCGTFGNHSMVLITTEKDAARIRSLKGIERIPIFYIPIEVQFLKDESLFERLVKERFSGFGGN